jgi:hypothetical protein
VITRAFFRAALVMGTAITEAVVAYVVLLTAQTTGLWT